MIERRKCHMSNPYQDRVDQADKWLGDPKPLEVVFPFLLELITRAPHKEPEARVLLDWMAYLLREKTLAGTALILGDFKNDTIDNTTAVKRIMKLNAETNLYLLVLNENGDQSDEFKQLIADAQKAYNERHKKGTNS